MSQFVINNGSATLDVLTGLIDMPLRGVWVADLSIVQDGENGLSVGDNVSIECVDADYTLNGTIVPDRQGSYLLTLHARIVGGAAGMANETTPKAYANGLIKDIINQLMKDSGETLDSSTDQSFLNTQVTWTVVRTTVSNALNLLLEKFAPTFNWRMLPNGNIFIGPETWNEIDSDIEFEVMNANPADSSFEIASLNTFLLPGQNIPDIGNCSRVLHDIGQTNLRTTIWTSLQDDDTRSLQASIISIAKQAYPNIDYLGKYKAKVISQDSDGKVDIKPDDDRLPQYSKLPIWYGEPGITVTVSPGAYVQLAFNNGDPTQPHVEIWESGTVLKMVIATSQELDLGGADPSDYVLLGTTYVNALTTFCNQLTAFNTALNTLNSALVVPTGILAPAKAAFATASTTFGTAITTFQNGLYLSNIVKVKS